MSQSQLRKQPIAEQIAAYEKEIEHLNVNIENCIKRRKELQRFIRNLQRPDAEAKYQKRMADSRRAIKAKERKEKQFARNRARMEREIEECLRMNGKI